MRKVIGITVLVFAVFLGAYRLLHKPILLEKCTYISISDPGYVVKSSEKEVIGKFVKYINEMYKRKTIKRHVVCQSPDVNITLTTEDGNIVDIEVYGGYMHYNDKQYAINYLIFHDDIEEMLKETLQRRQGD